ncbi:MAG TPA: hypothetical protein PLJ69_10445 [Methanothrix sp.]|jgi:hypothetical protein|nr:hypothetical protein [Methanothrix sp.]HQA63347.1 hypothetical protein [Methanothrix sp.]
MTDMVQILIESASTSFGLLSRSLPPMVLGLILAELIVVYDAAERIAFVARPITRFSHLSDATGASFMMAFFSAASANSMLAGYYHDGVIEKRELFVASLVNSFPATTMHWRSLLPVLIPLLGFTGLAYFGLLMLVGLLKTALVMAAGRLLLPGRPGAKAAEIIFEDLRVGIGSVSKDRPHLGDALKISARAARPKVVRVVKMTTAIMFLVSVLIQVGAFDLLSQQLSGIGGLLPLPAAGISIIAAQFAGYIAAYTVAGGLLAAGEVTGKEVVVTLMMGNVITSAGWAVRWLIPSHAGIFGPRIGTELVICSTGLRNVLMILVALGVMVLW